MNVRRVLAIALRQVYLIQGSMSRVLPLFIWVAVEIVLWGYITRYLNSITAAGLNFVTTLLGAVLLWNFLSRVMQGVTMAFFEDVWSRNFLNFFATPLSMGEYVGGLVLTGLATSALGLVVMLVLASMVFGLSMLTYGLAVFPFLLILLLFGIALGIFGCAVVLRLGPASEWFVWPIPGLLSPFVGVFYPLSTLPGWMQAIGRALPPSYVFEGMRAIATRQPLSPGSLAWGAGLAVVYVLLAGWFYSAVYHYAVRTGLIARYSAESVN